MATTMRLAFPAFLRCCTNVGCILALGLIILCCTPSKAEAQFSFLFCQLSFSQYTRYAGFADMAPPSKTQKFLSLEDTAHILAEVASGQKKAAIVEKFGISPSSLSTILKSKDALEKAFASGTSAKRKKLTPSAHEKLDKAIYTWFVQIFVLYKFGHDILFFVNFTTTKFSLQRISSRAPSTSL
uniref:Putative tigger transposase n=1 Tax=Ixodes ricinus TaxID=34613 RepID=V5GGN2_IXORI